MFLLLQYVDQLLRALHTGIRIEQRGIVRRVEHHVGAGLLGVGFDGREDLLLDRLDHFDPLFHQRAVVAEEALLKGLRLFFAGENGVFAGLAGCRRERKPVPLRNGPAVLTGARFRGQSPRIRISL